MITKKQMMYLRGLANQMRATHQVGKEGFTQNVINDLVGYLDKHELMKISVLQSCPSTKEEILNALKENEIEIVQVIGQTYVIYRHNDDAKDPVIFK